MIDNNNNIPLVFIEKTRRIKEVIIAWNPSRTTDPMIAVWSVIGRQGTHNRRIQIDTFGGRHHVPQPPLANQINLQ